MTRRSSDFLHVPAFWCLRTLWGPITALVIAGGGWFADRQGPSSSNGIPAGEPAESAISGIHRGTAVTCFTHPKVTLCYRLTKERG